MLEMVNRHMGDVGPNLLTEFFEGETRAWGFAVARFGRVRRRYQISLNGFWSGREFVLEEMFAFNDGEIEPRSWFFQFGEDGYLTGVCADLVGQASGRVTDDEIQLAYTFDTRVGNRIIALQFDDRMYRIDGQTLGGHTKMKKFGITVGELFTVFRR